MSPTVTASRETGNETCTVWDSPAASSILVQPTSRCGGASTVLTGWCTYTGTTVVPARVPVFETVNVAVSVPRRETELGDAESALVSNVVYESPKPNAQRGL